jgi:hypothetical protein
MADDWQPMESAPKDGTVVRLLCADTTEQLGWWYDVQAPDYVGWYSEESGGVPLTDLHGEPSGWQPRAIEIVVLPVATQDSWWA